MTDFPGETARNGPAIGIGASSPVSNEARLLVEVLTELRAIRAALERVEHQAAEGAREFLPAIRHMLGRRTVKAAASAGRIFKDGGRAI
jgi:hypothetical protein